MREIVLDTETTGMDPFTGDRIIEIGAVELVNHLPTGKTCQIYIQPERDVPQEAIAVHGITNDFLKDKPVFAECYMEFMDFIADDSKLVIHNADFDMKFLNWELENVGHKPIAWNRVIDTLKIARKKFPEAPLIWMRCVGGLILTTRRGPITARFWTPNCWRRCIWSCLAGVNAALGLVMIRKQARRAKP